MLCWGVSGQLLGLCWGGLAPDALRELYFQKAIYGVQYETTPLRFFFASRRMINSFDFIPLLRAMNTTPYRLGLKNKARNFYLVV